MKNRNLWDMEDIIKQLALNKCDKIGLFNTAEYLKISHDEVLECFIHLSRDNYPKINIKYLITCPICQSNLYSYEFENGLTKIEKQYYCHGCEDMIDTDCDYVYLQFIINKDYLESIKKYKRKIILEKARELAKYIYKKIEKVGLTYEEIQEDVYKVYLEIREKNKS